MDIACVAMLMAVLKNLPQILSTPLMTLFIANVASVWELGIWDWERKTLGQNVCKQMSALAVEFTETLWLLEEWGSVSCRWRCWSWMIASCVFHISWALFHLLIWDIFHPGYVLPSHVVLTSDGASLIRRAFLVVKNAYLHEQSTPTTTTKCFIMPSFAKYSKRFQLGALNRKTNQTAPPPPPQKKSSGLTIK